MNSVVYEMPVRRELPQPQGAISYLEWGADDPHKTPLHFAHANGFNGQTYSRILSGLSDRFHIRAWDARGERRRLSGLIDRVNGAGRLAQSSDRWVILRA